MSDRDLEFEQFFLDNYDDVMCAITLMTGDRERAVDATQVAFIQAYARWSRVSSLEIPAAWVRRVAIKASRDSYRADRRRRRREQPHIGTVEPSHADDVVATDFAISLLAELTDRQREIATLFYIDDRGVRDISLILGISAGTVKFHLSQARDTMRKILVCRADVT